MEARDWRLGILGGEDGSWESWRPGRSDWRPTQREHKPRHAAPQASMQHSKSTDQGMQGQIHATQQEHSPNEGILGRAGWSLLLLVADFVLDVLGTLGVCGPWLLTFLKMSQLLLISWEVGKVLFLGCLSYFGGGADRGAHFS